MVLQQGSYEAGMHCCGHSAAFAIIISPGISSYVVAALSYLSSVLAAPSSAPVVPAVLAVLDARTHSGLAAKCRQPVELALCHILGVILEGLEPLQRLLSALSAAPIRGCLGTESFRGLWNTAA